MLSSSQGLTKERCLAGFGADACLVRCPRSGLRLLVGPRSQRLRAAFGARHRHRLRRPPTEQTWRHQHQQWHWLQRLQLKQLPLRRPRLRRLGCAPAACAWPSSAAVVTLLPRPAQRRPQAALRAPQEDPVVFPAVPASYRAGMPRLSALGRGGGGMRASSAHQRAEACQETSFLTDPATTTSAKAQSASRCR